MTYDGVRYALADNIDPNRFSTQNWIGIWHTQHIWLKEEGKYICIDDDADSWAKLNYIKLDKLFLMNYI